MKTKYFAALLLAFASIMPAQVAPWQEVRSEGVAFSLPSDWVRIQAPGTLFAPPQSVYFENGQPAFSRGIAIGHVTRLPQFTLWEVSIRFGADWAKQQNARLQTPWRRVSPAGVAWYWAQYTLPSKEGGDELVDIVTTDRRNTMFWIAFARPAALAQTLQSVWEVALRTLHPAAAPAPSSNSTVVETELARSEALNRARVDYNHVMDVGRHK